MRLTTNLVRAAAWSVLLLCAAAAAAAQAPPADIEALKKTAPRVYLDCDSCQTDAVEYIKTEITFVNYVRDRKEAQVHVMITTQSTGSGGREYTLTFLGQNEYQGHDDTLRYFSQQSDTQDEIRKGLVKSLKIGLAGYAARTPIASRLSVDYEEPPRNGAVRDRWNGWVFSLSGNGYFHGESSTASHSWGLNVSANRVTPAVKLRLGLSADFENDWFDYEGVQIDSSQESYDFSGLMVFSLGEHWSAGFSVEAESSTYENILRRIVPAPAVEFNVFPYAQSTRRQLRILYTLGLEAVRYREETIYDKTEELLLKQELSVTLGLKEKWGSVTASLTGSNYFHDRFRFTKLGFFGYLNLNLVKGLSAFLLGGADWIRDQINLVKGEATLEEILLRRRELASSYSYFMSFGLSFTFGSIYTNVVNPRFGRLGSGGMSVMVN